MFTKKNLKNLSKEIDDFFLADPTPNQKAWGLIHDFYHTVLTYMEENGISKAELAKRLNISRSAISQSFNETPNISIKKMVEIADAIEYDLRFQLIPKDSYVYNTTYAGIPLTLSTLSYSELSQSAGVSTGSTWAGDQASNLYADLKRSPRPTVEAASDIETMAVNY